MGYKLGNHPKNIEPCAHRARTVRAPCDNAPYACDTGAYVSSVSVALWPLYKLQPCPGYSGRRGRINLVPNLIRYHPAHLWATSDVVPRSEALGTPRQ